MEQADKEIALDLLVLGLPVLARGPIGEEAPRPSLWPASAHPTVLLQRGLAVPRSRRSRIERHLNSDATGGSGSTFRSAVADWRELRSASPIRRAIFVAVAQPPVLQAPVVGGECPLGLAVTDAR